MTRLFSNHQIEARVNPTGESGFVLISVIFAIVIISVVSIGALVSSNDEQAAGRAIRESTDAFYAANAGLSAELAGWDQAARDADLIILGDSVDLGWTSLENGSSYRAVVRLTGLGGQRHYSLNVTGRNASQRAQRALLTKCHRAQCQPTSPAGAPASPGAVRFRVLLRLSRPRQELLSD